LFVPVSRAGVHKRIKEGKLTAFFFYITSEETTLFGAKRKAKQRPYIAVSVSECKAWAAEMKRKVGYIDEPNESPLRLWDRLRPTSIKEEPKTPKEAKEADDFANTDPKDKGNRKVKYRDHKDFTKEDKQQDWHYLMAELQAAMLSGGKAEAFRKRLQMGMEWDKKRKSWKLKGGQEEK
jgi:PIN domain nuclease of toxin-antitoxin system